MTCVLKGIRPGRSGGMQKGANGSVFRESEIYTVVSDNLNESLLTVLNTTGLPKVGISVKGDTGARCTGVDPAQHPKQPRVWDCSVSWSTEVEDQETEGSPDPTEWIPIYKGTLETYPEVIYYDFSDPPKPYINYAGKRFPDPLVAKRPIVVYSFIQYMANSWTDEALGDLNDVMNAISFRGFAARTLKCNLLDFTRGLYYGYPCVQCSFRVAYKKTGWLNKPLQMGYEYRPSAGAKAIPTEGGRLVALNTNGTVRDDTLAPLAGEFLEARDLFFASFLR